MTSAQAEVAPRCPAARVVVVDPDEALEQAARPTGRARARAPSPTWRRRRDVVGTGERYRRPDPVGHRHRGPDPPVNGR